MSCPQSVDPVPIPSQFGKSSRVLSCVLCQQRKIRCDRTFPCANCVKSKAQCVPANQVPRRRKRRFAERELLNRLREYENLLRQNDIKFDPLHSEGTREGDNRDSLHSGLIDGREPDSSSPSTGLRASERPYQAKNFWHAINQVSAESDDDSNTSQAAMTETVVKKAWDQVFGKSDPLFGTQNIPVDLSSLHPEPSQILRLWQAYLDNVDPLFKVTHTPTLQSRIIEAIGDLKHVKPPLEALMFSIYCMATLSLKPYNCAARLGSLKDDLLAKYQLSCRQALVHCEFLRSDDRDCLTAFYLYLVSLRPSIDPRSLSSMLAIAVRAAQRMGIHNESACARYPPLEAEMRRRLWWALALFDTRIGEMADYRTSTLTPLWDCKIPLNVNDLDLRPEMRMTPSIQGPLSETVFIVVRSELGDFLRNSSFHLDFTCPALKAIARKEPQHTGSEAGELAALETMVEERYLKFCNPENPLHFLTIWVTRGSLAKCRLIEHYSKHPTGRQTEVQRDATVSHALCMLDCDTQILTSASAKGYLWFMHFHFPFPAYLHILQDLRRRPLSAHAEKCWSSLSENFEARANYLRCFSPNLLFRTLTGIVFQAWEASESALRGHGHSSVPPKIVTIMRQFSAQTTDNTNLEYPSGAISLSGVTPWPTQLDMGLQDPQHALGGSAPQTWMRFDLGGQLLDNNWISQPDWSFINWGL